jgi:hypothetical protein
MTTFIGLSDSTAPETPAAVLFDIGQTGERIVEALQL